MCNVSHTRKWRDAGVGLCLKFPVYDCARNVRSILFLIVPPSWTLLSPWDPRLRVEFRVRSAHVASRGVCALIESRVHCAHKASLWAHLGIYARPAQVADGKVRFIGSPAHMCVSCAASVTTWSVRWVGDAAGLLCEPNRTVCTR